jgi:hypothetical protein
MKHTRGIDDVDCILLLLIGGWVLSLPVAVGGGTLDGNALFPLQLHAVHLGADRVPTTNLNIGSAPWMTTRIE